MKKTLLSFLITLTIPLIVNSQDNASIQWKTWNELETELNSNPKPVFIFFTAKWCAYCKKIKQNAFKDPKVISYINKNYYAVTMDVESTKIIVFDGITFKNKEALTKRNGIHEIPLLLASRDNIPFSLPATVFLKPDFNVRKRVFEYYTSEELLKLLEH